MYIFKIIKNTFYKKLFTKIYLQKLYFELLGIEKNMYTYLFKIIYKKICLQVINYKDPIYPYPFMFLHTEIKHCLSGYSFSYGTSMDGADFNTSEKNEGLALVKKMKV